MQSPADVQEPQTPPLATRHRQAVSRRAPGDTTGGSTGITKGGFPLMRISNGDIITNACISTQVALQNY